MSKRIPTVTRQLIESAVLPVQTKTYTVISHGDVIATTEKVLAEKGLEIIQERYKCTKSAQVAQGVYFLNHGNDPDMKMMFAWSNSYDKSLRFRCAIGGNLSNGATIISGHNLGSWARRHSGTALQETTVTINDQISNAAAYYDKLVEDKIYMQQIQLNFTDQCALAGKLFVEKDLINTEQVSEMKVWLRDTRDTETTVWNFYTYLVTALQKSHPAKWMDCQIAAHLWVQQEFSMPVPQVVLITPSVFTSPVVSSNQIDLEDSIKEITQETGEPEVLPTGFQPLTEPVVIEKTPEGEPLMSAQFGTLDVSSDNHDFTGMPVVKSKPKADDLVKALKEQSEAATEENIKEPLDTLQETETILDIMEENEATEPWISSIKADDPHIFTVESDDDVVCLICQKDILDPIHDELS